MRCVLPLKMMKMVCPCDWGVGFVSPVKIVKVVWAYGWVEGVYHGENGENGLCLWLGCEVYTPFENGEN